MRASWKGHCEVVKLLLEKGAQVDLQDGDGWSALMRASQNGQCKVLVSLIYSYMSIIIETLHDQSFSLTSEDSLRDSKLPVNGYPRTKGYAVITSQCMKLVLVSFTLIYSATCALLSFHINVCAGYMCFVKL